MDGHEVSSPANIPQAARESLLCARHEAELVSLLADFGFKTGHDFERRRLLSRGYIPVPVARIAELACFTSCINLERQRTS